MEHTIARVSSRSYRAPSSISGPLVALVATALVLAPFDPARAGQISLGVPGGLAKALVVDPMDSGVVYAGTGDGVFVSRDAGATWRLENDGIRGSVLHLIADPERAGTLYAGTSEGLFKSTDGASSWAKLETGSGSVLDLVMDPQDRNVLYVAQDRGGILRTADGGESWSPLSDGLGHFTMAALAVDPHEPGTLYAASAGSYSPRSTSSLYESTDRGAHWHLMAPQPDDVLIHSIRIDPAPPGRLYLTTSGGMFRSSQEAGSSWQGPLRHGPERPSVEFLKIESGELYAGTSGHGLFRSTDQGAAWQPVQTGLEDFRLLSFTAAPSTPKTLYVGTAAGVFRTTPGASEWTATGFPNGVVRSLAIDTTQPSTIYAAASVRGGFRTTDGGASWQSLGFPYVNDIVVNRSGVVVLSTGEEVWISHDGGEAWNPVESLGRGGVSGLAAAPASDEIYVVTSPGRLFEVDVGAGTRVSSRPELPEKRVLDVMIGVRGRTYVVTDGSGLLRRASPDDPWQPTAFDSLPTLLAIDGGETETVYVTQAGGRVLATTYAGDTWRYLGEGPWKHVVTSLVVDPKDPDVLYVGTYEGLFKSTDGGAEWRRLRSGLGVSILSLVAHPTEGGVVYAGSYGAGVFETTDGGESWRALGPATSAAFDH